MAISFVRTIILYILIVIALRIMGKRQISELDPIDLVISLLISDLAAIPMQDAAIPLIYGVVPIATLIAFEVLSSFLALKSSRFRTALNGHPVVIISHGKIDMSQMKKMRLTNEEIVSGLRQQGISSVSDVKYGVFETNGQLSVVLYPPKQPLTAEVLQIDAPDTGLPVVVISDGKLRKNSLIFLKKDEKEILGQLRNRGLAVKDVMLMTLDDCGNTFIQTKENVR